MLFLQKHLVNVWLREFYRGVENLFNHPFPIGAKPLQKSGHGVADVERLKFYLVNWKLKGDMQKMLFFSLGKI